VRIAWTGRGNDSQDAALSALAETVYGESLLWITTVGLAALTMWQISPGRPPAALSLAQLVSQLAAFFRLGCTLGGSPGIFGYSGG
jgi:uncharacterized membrane protein